MLPITSNNRLYDKVRYRMSDTTRRVYCMYVEHMRGKAMVMHFLKPSCFE